MTVRVKTDIGYHRGLGWSSGVLRIGASGRVRIEVEGRLRVGLGVIYGVILGLGLGSQSGVSPLDGI